ncbi:hypothetical protein, conserved [Eimeria tenella]|uniref:Nucleolar complex-associated protein 3 N-terminal domain-containing protein n=1 Tax=Eimeria tenella TaxID=5802 RepID=U6KS57_EIMTE|nr:hypothetical protein, conserved [Eimeria tenella]CDJ39204.1 hypothetical protein, conserved [Eimeria tenella]|eukprot:XP_013229959.1 hypothetical protein, conserved [Eimeria tenella]
MGKKRRREAAAAEDAAAAGAAAPAAATVRRGTLLQSKLQRLMPSTTSAALKAEAPEMVLPVRGLDGVWTAPGDQQQQQQQDEPQQEKKSSGKEKKVKRQQAKGATKSSRIKGDNTSEDVLKGSAAGSTGSSRSSKGKAEEEISESAWAVVRSCKTLQQKKQQMAAAAARIMASPERSFEELDIFFAFCSHSRSAAQTVTAAVAGASKQTEEQNQSRRLRLQELLQTRQLAVLSLAVVLKDILPRHRLTAAAAAETAAAAAADAAKSGNKNSALKAFRLSKDVEKQQQVEQQFIRTHRRFVLLLQQELQPLLQRKPGSCCSNSDLLCAASAARAAAEVVSVLPRFNDSDTSLLQLAVKAAAAATAAATELQQQQQRGDKLSWREKHQQLLQEAGRNITETLQLVVAEDKGLQTAAAVIDAAVQQATATALQQHHQTCKEQQDWEQIRYARSTAAAALADVALKIELRKKLSDAERDQIDHKVDGALRRDLQASSINADLKSLKQFEGKILQTLFVLYAKTLRSPEVAGAPLVLASLRGVCTLGDFVRDDLLLDFLQLLREAAASNSTRLLHLGPATAVAWVLVPLLLARKLRTSLQTDYFWAAESIIALLINALPQFAAGQKGTQAGATPDTVLLSLGGGDGTSFFSSRSRGYNSSNDVDAGFARKLLRAFELLQQTPQLWGGGGAQQQLQTQALRDATTSRGAAAIRVDENFGLAAGSSRTSTGSTAYAQAVLQLGDAFLSCAPLSDISVGRRIVQRLLRQLQQMPLLCDAVTPEGATGAGTSLHFVLLLLTASCDPQTSDAAFAALGLADEQKRLLLEKLEPQQKRRRMLLEDAASATEAAQTHCAGCAAADCTATDLCCFSAADEQFMLQQVFLHTPQPPPLKFEHAADRAAPKDTGASADARQQQQQQQQQQQRKLLVQWSLVLTPPRVWGQ